MTDHVREARWRLQVEAEVAELRRLADELERSGPSIPTLRAVSDLAEDCGQRLYKLWDEVTDAGFDAQDRTWAVLRQTKGRIA